MSSILIIDDEDKYLELCRRHMSEHQFLGPARNYRQASELLLRHRNEVDLVLLDVHFDIPDADLLPYDKAEALSAAGDRKALERLRRSQGLRILDQLRRRHPDLPVVVMTSRDDLPIEADSERLNAENYTYLLDDEYLDARSLRIQVEGILAQRRRPAQDEDEPFYWGQTSAMRKLRRRLTILARGQLPIIIQGETGTGKSLLAREFIHAHSGRSGPFVAVDLSTIPDELMGAHLFGVIKGAYTGATASREGMLARAHGGTLFLDEIGNLSVELQKSLLLVLQDRRYRPVGSTEERQVDIKLVVATNEDLPAMVREGRFREDLFMRLNPATAVRLPSLRERRDDFQQLLEFFVNRVVSEEAYNRDLLHQYAAQRGLRVSEGAEGLEVSIGRRIPSRLDRGRIFFLLHASSFKLMRDFEWPGNFRQLEMLLSNLLTFTLVDLVGQPDQVEPQGDDQGRPDVVPIPPRTVTELLRPWESQARESEGADQREGHWVSVQVETGESLNAVSCAVERQYLEESYRRLGGDLSRVAELLLGDESAGRKVQLRMNQLGIKLRDLKRGRS